jgi:hypothetical protein
MKHRVRKRGETIMSQSDFDLVYDSIIDLLDKPGEIVTGKAVKLSGLPYSRGAYAFYSIMAIMIKQRKAVKVSRGVWKILKANRSNPIYRVPEQNYSGAILAN